MIATVPRWTIENGVVRSHINPRRGEIEPLALLKTGRWPNGDALAGSDAYDLARHVRPAPSTDKRSVLYRGK